MGNHNFNIGLPGQERKLGQHLLVKHAPVAPGCKIFEKTAK
jgi:hypothetical protein